MSEIFACDYCGKIMQRDEVYTMSISKRHYKPLSETGDSYIGVNRLDERCDLCVTCVLKIKKLKNGTHLCENDIFSEKFYKIL